MTTTDLGGVEQAFADLEKEPTAIQGLLRPVLVQAMQDPALMRHLGSSALSQHLAVLGQLLVHLSDADSSSPLPPLKTFEYLTIGEDVEDPEEAYRFVQNLDPEVRQHVEAGLSRVLQNRAIRANQGTISLLALARLLAIAYTNLPFVAHVLDGGSIEPFVPEPSQTRAARDSARPKPGPKKSSRPEPPETVPHLDRFVGTFVEVVSVVTEGSAQNPGRVFVTIGRVLEISPTHVVLQLLRGHSNKDTEAQTLLLGMASVIAMRTLKANTRSNVAG